MNRILLLSFVIVAAGSVMNPLSEARAEDWVVVDESTRPFIGVYPSDLDAKHREKLGFKGEGILVSGVVGDGPAEKAGIKEGDVITRIDDDATTTEAEFRSAIRKHRPGDVVKVHLMRKGTEMDFTLELAKRSETTTSISVPGLPIVFGAESKRGFLGVETITVDDQLAEYFGVSGGALVQNVVEGSPAELAGLKAGDVITKFGDDLVKGSEGLRTAIRRKTPDDKVDIRIVRKGQEMTLSAQLGNSKDSEIFIGKNPRIIIKHGETEDIDFGEIEESVGEAFREVEIQIRDSQEDVREQIERLKQELQELREEMRRKEKQKKEEEKKEEPKKG